MPHTSPQRKLPAKISLNIPVSMEEAFIILSSRINEIIDYLDYLSSEEKVDNQLTIENRTVDNQPEQEWRKLVYRGSFHGKRNKPTEPYSGINTDFGEFMSLKDVEYVLSSQKSQLIKKIKGMKKEKPELIAENLDARLLVSCYNEAIDDILSTLQDEVNQ